MQLEVHKCNHLSPAQLVFTIMHAPAAAAAAAPAAAAASASAAAPAPAAAAAAAAAALPCTTLNCGLRKLSPN